MICFMDGLKFELKAFFETQQVLSNSFFYIIPDTYTMPFGIIANGDSSRVISGSLMIIGIICAVVKGV